MKVQFLVFLLLICSVNSLRAQKLDAPICFAKDTILGNAVEYAIIGDTTQKKPLLLYCTGSLPQPIFFSTSTRKMASILPFDYKKYANQCHILIVSKPFIPVFADSTELDGNFCYLDRKTKTIPLAFRKRNTLDELSKDTDGILQKIVQKNWVDSTKILAMGHSQGARIAFELTKTNKVVTHLVINT